VNDDDVRALVREAIERHLGAEIQPASSPLSQQAPSLLSFHRYKLPRASDDVMCLIEPAVRCNHCGYCECHGH